MRDLSLEEVIENPYWLPWATYRSLAPISISAVDRACYPPPSASWSATGRLPAGFTDHKDPRRVEAMLVEVLERAAANGDTLVPQNEVIGAISDLHLDVPPDINSHLLAGLGLDCAALEEIEEWTPIVGARLDDGSPALKLLRLEGVRSIVVEWITKKLQQKRYPAAFDAKAAMDAVLPVVEDLDGEELLARKEKAASLTELFSSRVSVLVGAAGTGKTSLLRALVDLPEIKAKGVLLLAPTGKARVQLERKVGVTARTLASYLIPFGAYDGGAGVYALCEPKKRTDAGLVVIDEASMLTEEMLAAVISTLGMVDRLVLVGDPRQLPPIGAGRPFVDLVEKLRPDEQSSALRVSPGYCELQVIRRQTTGGDPNAQQRDDLTLASWFGGGDLPGDADGVWERLRSGDSMPTLEAIQVKDADFTKSLMSALRANLDLKVHEDREYAFKLSYGAALSPDGKWINWKTGERGGGDHCEDWQILSPTRTRAFGTLEINRFIKRTFRQKDLQNAMRPYGWRSARPVGPEQIVLGDKVVQTVNDSRARAYPKGSGLDYVANGEIGVVIGPWHNKTKARPAQVEFSSQVGAVYSYWSSREDPPLELAWAVTVHKSQGSEFGTTFVVLPEKVRVSRELLYTALTRQSNKVVLLHQGDINSLRDIADASRSETARRLTDLFRAPAPRTLPIGDAEVRFDGNLIHVASNGVLVRSKNEVIVADILELLAPGQWRYEMPLVGKDGSQKLPDFTVETPAGDRIYWEHLGMMNNPRYAQAWEAKKAWYRENGVRPYDEEDTDESNGVLIWTNDLHGVDQPAWMTLAESSLGLPAATSAPAGRNRRRR